MRLFPYHLPGLDSEEENLVTITRGERAKALREEHESPCLATDPATDGIKLRVCWKMKGHPGNHSWQH